MAAIVAVLVLVATAGCNDDDEPTPPTTRRTTTTTDPFAVPDPIDAAYVERVVAELDHLYGDAAREVAREQALTPRFETILRAIYGDDEELELARKIWLDEEAAGFVHLAREPGDPKTTAIQLLLATSECVIAAVDRDLSAVASEQRNPPSTQLYVVLVPLRAEHDPKDINSTGWALGFEGFKADGSAPGEEECGESR